ncbi:MAG TPA: antibiotic biosynthesis monooxygenase [Candidatus Acidoferrales bacterium]
MTFISITRLHVRSYLYLPVFVWRAQQSISQSQSAPGFIHGRLMRESSNTWWTITAWDTDAAMNAFRTSGAHQSVMPKLMVWCDEASVVHWTQPTTDLPTWAEAHRRMLAEGRFSKVNDPSPAQIAKEIPAPIPTRITRELQPATPPR